MSSEDEEEYMSEAILLECASNDIRPSLLFKPGDKRKHEMQMNKEKANAINKQKFKSARVLEEETRAAGLQKAIGSENKGFQLLSKMGYKPGTSLGSSSVVEPIQLDIKMDRKGLGQKTKNNETLERVKKNREELEKLIDPEQFRHRSQAVAAKRSTERDVREAQSACRNLDIQKGKDIPISSWYWPRKDPEVKLVEDSETVETGGSILTMEDDGSEHSEEGTEPEVEEILAELTNYLRSEYLYCIWCGTSFNNEEDLQSSCPGNSRDVH